MDQNKKTQIAREAFQKFEANKSELAATNQARIITEATRARAYLETHAEIFSVQTAMDDAEKRRAHHIEAAHLARAEFDSFKEVQEKLQEQATCYLRAGRRQM